MVIEGAPATEVVWERRDFDLSSARSYTWHSRILTGIRVPILLMIKVAMERRADAKVARRQRRLQFVLVLHDFAP